VNKLLNVSSKNLKDLLAAHVSILGRSGPLKKLIFMQGSFTKLSRGDGTRARWIYLDLTGAGPTLEPGIKLKGNVIFIFLSHLFRTKHFRMPS
jgi:hypothetical protein